MATAQTIINRALRLCRVIDAEAAMSANDADDALETLNAMLAEWHAAGIGLPDYAFTSLTTELATDAGDREAIAYQLAMRVAPEYGATLTPEIVALANATMDRLRLRYFQPGCVDFSELPSKTEGFDIVTGDY
jgi:hypothetical protein